MSEFINFWRCYADFRGRTTGRGFCMAFFIWLLTAFFGMICVGMILVIACSFDAERAVQITELVKQLYGLVSVVPLLSMTVRRLRDAGYSAKSFWWLLIPGLGMIAFTARLCGKSVTADISAINE